MVRCLTAVLFRPIIGQMISPQTLPVTPEGKTEVSRENSGVDFSKVRVKWLSCCIILYKHTYVLIIMILFLFIVIIIYIIINI